MRWVIQGTHDKYSVHGNQWMRLRASFSQWRGTRLQEAAAEEHEY